MSNLQKKSSSETQEKSALTTLLATLQKLASGLLVAGGLITFVCWIKNFSKGPLPQDWRIALIAGLSLIILASMVNIILDIVKMKKHKNPNEIEKKLLKNSLCINIINIILYTGLLVSCALILGKVFSTEAILTVDKVFAWSPLIGIGIGILSGLLIFISEILIGSKELDLMTEKLHQKTAQADNLESQNINKLYKLYSKPNSNFNPESNSELKSNQSNLLPI